MHDLHPALAPLEFLLGVWRGAGEGRYPTIDAFAYTETATYTPGPGKPFIIYRQTTHRLGAEQEPLHSETGYIRPVSKSVVELVISQPTGIVEVHTGVVQDHRIDFQTSLVGLSATAVEVSRVRRIIEVKDNAMTYRLHMEAARQPMQVHLKAALTREP